MLRVDEHLTRASVEACFRVAAEVERWPMILPHYRWVNFREKRGYAAGIVEMAAWRPFGVFNYPTWWVSRMWHDPEAPVVFYHHIEGITRGMNVRWEFESREGGRGGSRDTLIRVVHEWQGPSWPFVGGIAARAVIGPGFISAIARRTIAGVAANAERGVHEEWRP